MQSEHIPVLEVHPGTAGHKLSSMHFVEPRACCRHNTNSNTNQTISLLTKMMFDPDFAQWCNANEGTEATREEVEAENMVSGILMELLSSPEEEEEMQRGGSRKGQARNKERRFAAAHAKLTKD
jgi:hypothetical protein